jgi:COP9 signalosome complex subunit 1
MAHRDLGDYYRSVGDSGTALKHYTKSREFCASSQQVIEMCLSVLEVVAFLIYMFGGSTPPASQLLIEQRNYSHILTYVFKAEAALDAVNAASAKDANRPSPSHPPPENKRSEEREKVQSKLDLAAALAHLGHGRYGKAANAFLKLGSVEKLGDWVGKARASFVGKTKWY